MSPAHPPNHTVLRSYSIYSWYSPLGWTRRPTAGGAAPWINSRPSYAHCAVRHPYASVFEGRTLQMRHSACAITTKLCIALKWTAAPSMQPQATAQQQHAQAEELLAACMSGACRADPPPHTASLYHPFSGCAVPGGSTSSISCKGSQLSGCAEHTSTAFIQPNYHLACFGDSVCAGRSRSTGHQPAQAPSSQPSTYSSQRCRPSLGSPGRA